MMNNILMSIICLFLTISTNGQQKLDKNDLNELKNRMIGSFSSEQQSKADTAFFDIRLHMAPIWEQRNDGYWLYVEQAVATAPDKPYRQRIYHVYQENDSTMVSKVYELNSPLRFAGAWKNTGLLSSITPDSLIDRKGCGIFLHRDKEGNFAGSTPGKECLSSLRGATYATSEVVIEKTKLISWDRGWNNADKQVWGAVKGGYAFIKQSE